MKSHLTADQLLLINQWVEFYKKVPEQTLEKIKKEVSMELLQRNDVEEGKMAYSNFRIKDDYLIQEAIRLAKET